MMVLNNPEVYEIIHQTLALDINQSFGKSSTFSKDFWREQKYD